MAVVQDNQSELKTNQPIPFQALEAALLARLQRGDLGAVLAVESAIEQAVLRACSDLYFEPRRSGTLLRFRIDGALIDVAQFPREFHERIIARIKVLAQLPVYQHSAPMDGRIEPADRWKGRSLRVSTLPTIEGEKAVLRVVDPERTPLELDSLGLRPEVVAGLHGLIARPQGVLLLTGPSSSGKTTTIYALLARLLADARRTHIITVEDPVEYRLEGICQTQARPDAGYDYTSALRAILRQDPDVIVVGEIRDPGTAQTAIQAGLTGHLVLSTIHCGSAAGVFTRLLDMELQPYLVASAVNGALAQRLIRLNCPECSAPYSPPAQLRRLYKVEDDGAAFARGQGCHACNGLGRRGRTAISELLLMNDDIAEIVLSRGRTRTLHAAAVSAGMKTLVEHGLEKVRAGAITLQDLQLAVLPEER